jgi:hypothetical protein
MRFSSAVIITLLLFSMRSQNNVVDTLIDYELDSQSSVPGRDRGLFTPPEHPVFHGLTQSIQCAYSIFLQR